ncbi:hypothetical protein JCM18899A_08270 [Nocardioides sp. AN3]
MFIAPMWIAHWSIAGPAARKGSLSATRALLHRPRVVRSTSAVVAGAELEAELDAVPDVAPDAAEDAELSPADRDAPDAVEDDAPATGAAPWSPGPELVAEPEPFWTQATDAQMRPSSVTPMTRPMKKSHSAR